MRKRLTAALLCCLLTVSALLCAPTAIARESAEDIERLIDDIAAFKQEECGAQNVQEWIELGLAPGAGISSETYILALHQSGEIYDYSAYSLGLLGYLDGSSVTNAVSGQKYALSLMAANCGGEFVDSAADRFTGEMGIMSWVFGLHLINNGCVCERYTAADITAKLLELRLEDGGWAVSGGASDVDVTAMVLQALAPHCGDSDVQAAVDGALAFLSESQLPDGTYSSYGKNNAESSAQVITALSALEIDCRTDERFIKNGSSVLDGLLTFRLENGSFSHEPGGSYSNMATAQAFGAMISVRRLQESSGSLYVLDPQPDNTVEYIPLPTDDGTQQEESAEKSGGYGRVWACLAVAAAGAVSCVVLFATGRRSRRNFLAAALFTAAAMVIVLCTDIQCASDYYGDDGVSKTDIIGTVTMSIRCDSIAGEGAAEHIPADGVILGDTEFSLSEGETVYDILIEAARRYGVQVEHNGSGPAAYIIGIDCIYEFEYGELSGWVYTVNGETSSSGCAGHVLSDGDVIRWIYTCELGREL